MGRLVSHYTYTSSGRLETASIDLTDNDDPEDAFEETYTFDAAGNLTGQTALVPTSTDQPPEPGEDR